MELSAVSDVQDSIRHFIKYKNSLSYTNSLISLQWCLIQINSYQKKNSFDKASIKTLFSIALRSIYVAPHTAECIFMSWKSKSGYLTQRNSPMLSTLIFVAIVNCIQRNFCHLTFTHEYAYKKASYLQTVPKAHNCSKQNFYYSAILYATQVLGKAMCHLLITRWFSEAA